MSMQEKYEQALKSIPAPGGAGCHVALLGAANLGALAGINESQIFRDIRGAIPKGDRNVPDREIASAVRKAIVEADPSIARTSQSMRPMIHPPRPKPAIDGKAALAKMIEAGRGAQEVDIWEMSRIRLDDQPGPWESILFLESMYRMDEYVFIGDTYDRHVFTVAEHIDFIKSGQPTKPQIMINPMTGEAVPCKDGKPSYRCDASVAAYRYALVEFDDTSRDDQLAFWYGIIAAGKIPVSCLIDSGGKSIHAWLPVMCKDIDEYTNKVIDKLYDPERGFFTILGADRAVRNPSRQSRLPGHYRKDKQNWQRLLYLDPISVIE